MSIQHAGIEPRENDRIRVDEEYELSAWAHYFNASERRVKEAVAAVGDRAVRVREHLRSTERPQA
ncbi:MULTISPECIES: DUF3606 domain-containing protein [Ramlibacter]|uniref:DUF3606 domain-containing protein n=1 Tax=Ramlibacter aquaticus TaxID=2780094 RepID=A0ABR9SFQ7_9BURK|nr:MULTISPECIES: DUF3606 domain-containing protein [Ramlibacter]MBE7940744.1 DUF3606 domain-containing protein [Ramlibacter aquaticus]